MSYDHTEYSYDRREGVSHTASGGLADFKAALMAAVHLDGRQLIFRGNSLGPSATLYMDFINLPSGVGGAGGGAEAENNRMMFSVDGFDRKDNDAPPPSGKLKVEMRLSTLPREHKLRAKSGTPAQVAKYLADFINKVVKEVPPRFTHTKV